MIEFDNDVEKRANSAIKIKVFGIGGAGGNTVNSMIDSELTDVDYVVANTDLQALNHSKASTKIQLGVKATRGLGSGANPELGKRATEEDIDKILETTGDADIVFIAAGMGGGTGSGGAPVVAKALREKGVLTIAVVTKPFTFEGKRRQEIADQSLARLKKEVDTMIVIPNQRLLDLVDRSVSMIDSFAMINETLIHSVKGIADIITRSGHINVDFADLRAIMKGMGLAMMGTGSATGEDRAREAAQKAISSPLLENINIKEAKGVLLNITGGSSLSLHEINDAASVIYDESDHDAHIILGSVIDPSLTDEVIVSVIATGFDSSVKPAERDNQDDILTQDNSDYLEPVKEEPHVAMEQETSIELEVEEVEEKGTILDLKSSQEKLTDQDSLDVPTFLRKQQAATIEILSDQDSTE